MNVGNAIFLDGSTDNMKRTMHELMAVGKGVCITTAAKGNRLKVTEAARLPATRLLITGYQLSIPTF